MVNSERNVGKGIREDKEPTLCRKEKLKGQATVLMSVYIPLRETCATRPSLERMAQLE
jgi:hypothetical protein